MTGGGAGILRAVGVTVRRSGRVILDTVDLDVSRGEIVTIVGPNGAGKTTLVRVLVGLDQPDSGRVERESGLRIGYVPQRFQTEALLPLTVRRLMTLGHGKRAAADDAAIRAALTETGVPHLLEAATQTLSGGETQRVLLARALLRQPDILILDEPAQGVDFRGQLDLYDLIARLRSRHGMSVLMISHDLHVVMAATDRVVCLHHHVCCIGHPEAVAQDPAYQRLFGREAAGHVALYTHDHHHVHGPDGQVQPGLVSCGHDHSGHTHHHGAHHHGAHRHGAHHHGAGHDCALPSHDAHFPPPAESLAGENRHD